MGAGYIFIRVELLIFLEQNNPNDIVSNQRRERNSHRCVSETDLHGEQIMTFDGLFVGWWVE